MVVFAEMDFSTLDSLITKIIEKLSYCQDLSHGALSNPIAKQPVDQDTACGAEVFAIGFALTGNADLKRRAENALEYLEARNVLSGAVEPLWSPIGWYEKPGSVYTTGTVLEAVCNARSVLNLPSLFEESPTAKKTIWQFLEKCEVGPGLMAHDAVTPGKSPAGIQNIAAIALYLMELTSRPVDDGKTIDIKNRILDGQRQDGFWSYVYPGLTQQQMNRFKLGGSILKSRLGTKVLFRNDRSLYFGDFVHHCYVLYYVVCATNLSGDRQLDQSIKEGWSWILKKIVSHSDGQVSLDYSWEPGPDRIRFCNFLDTNAYFIVAQIANLLAQRGLINEEIAVKIIDGLYKKIVSDLVEDKETIFKPLDGDIEKRRRILPAIWQSDAWKSVFLMRLVHSNRTYWRALCEKSGTN
jgi:hypothetical protein